VNLDENGNVTSVVDAQTTVAFYLAACKAQGFGEPCVLIE
jgi:hypothetical protein